MASSAESEQGSVQKKKLTRLGSFSSKEVFCIWAKDSLLKPSTIQTLIEIHEIDSLPSVLALRSKDISLLGLPIGQARLFQEAVIKLHAEYKYQEPYSPATRVDVEFPKYKNMLDEGSPVDHGDGDLYFRFNKFGTYAEDIGIEVGDTSCDGKTETDKKLLHDNNRDEDSDDENRFGCACQRWLFISIFMPLILGLSLVGCILWLLLWPINRLCPCGKTFSITFNSVENLAKLPVTSIEWAIGRRISSETEPSGPNQNSSETTRKSYGTTDDVTMLKELDKAKR